MIQIPPEMLLPSCLVHFLKVLGDLPSQFLASLAETRFYYTYRKTYCALGQVLEQEVKGCNFMEGSEESSFIYIETPPPF